jgi:hypothetical protein
MTEEERDKVAQDTLYYLIEVHTLLSRISDVLQYPISVHETGRETRY